MLSGHFLYFYDYVFLVKDPENQEYHRGKKQRIDQGSELIGTEYGARGKVEELIALRDHSGADEGHKRVHPHGLEGLEGLAVSLQAHHVHQKGEREHRPSTGEKHIGSRPKRLRDRYPYAQDHRQHKRTRRKRLV